MNVDDLVLTIGTLQSAYTDRGLVDFTGEVRLEEGEEEDDPASVLIGHVIAYVLNPELLDLNPFEALDSVSGDLFAMAEDMASDGDGLRIDYDRLGIGPWSPLLLLESIQIDERYRGHGFGPAIATLTIQAVGHGCDLVLAYPAPMGDPLYGKTREQAVDALGRTWAKVGFAPLRRGRKKLGTWAVEPGNVKPIAMPL